MLVIMIRVKFSGYRRELVRSYYHDNSLIKCTETWSLAQKPALELGSSLGDHSELLLVILAISESASSSVNPPVIRDLYISWSRTADSSRADKPSKPCKFSILKNLSEATDIR